MTQRKTALTFPEGATVRDKVIITLWFPRKFVSWCRKRVGMAPNVLYSCPHGCVMEEYLRDVAGAAMHVGMAQIHHRLGADAPITTPTWVQRVLDRVDNASPRPTYHDLANMLVEALDKGELA